MHARSRLAAAGLSLSLTAAGAWAQPAAWPAKPVRIVVGFSPGGGTDTAARLVASALAEPWNQQVLVENRPGAGGNAATEYVARQPPDGTTLLLCNIGSHGVSPARFAKKLAFDPIADYAFPAYLGGVPNVFMVHPSLPFRTLKDFVAYARKHPGKLNFGSSGVGASPHMSMELMMSMLGIKLVHVPYKSAAAALADVLAGNIESSVGNLAGGPLGAIRAGRLRALGVTSGVRSPQLPEVPTFAEQGLSDFDVTGWYGLCTQAKVPSPVLARINTDVNRLLAPGQPLRARLEDQAVDVAPTTQEAFAALVKNEIARWTRIVREAKLEAE